MGIYRGVGGTGDSSIGQDVQGSNSTITDLIGLQGPIKKPTYIEFDQAAGITPIAGQVTWNATEGTLDVGLNGGTVVLQVGEETLYRVTNFSGSTIPNGSLVCYAGTTGNSGKLKVALWDGSQPANTILGLTTDEILQGENGFVTHFGKVRGIQTNGGNYGETWVDGDILYADPTGGLTKVKPEAPDTKSTIAVVINAHGSNGTFFVRPSLSSNLNDDDLVQLTSLANGDILQYNSTSGRFENETLSIALGTDTTGDYVASMTAGTGISVGTATGEGSTPVITNTAPDQTVVLTEGSGVTITGTYPEFTISAEGASGVPDGDKGDIVVSSSGTVWTIDNDAVSYSKIQNVTATDKLLGRVSSGAGDIEEITCTAAGRALLDDADASAQRTTLGLGTAATTASTDYATAAQGALADSALQPGTIGVTVQGYDVDTTKNDVANTFTANQVISVTDNSNAALRVTQLGTGDAFVVEDSSNPDSTSFVINASGNTGVGAAPSVVATDKLVVGGSLVALDGGFRVYSDNNKANNWLDSTGTTSRFQVGYNPSTTQAYIQTVVSAPLLIATNSVERIRFSVNGGISFGSAGTAFGTSGQVLQSNGDAAPTWVDVDAGGMTLLGTLNTTSGSTQTLSGLTLTGYKRLYISFNCSTNTGGASIRINGADATDGVAASGVARGFGNIDLDNQSYIGFAKDASSASSLRFIFNTNINTASTSISFTTSSGNFDAGTIKVYGVK